MVLIYFFLLELSQSTDYSQNAQLKNSYSYRFPACLQMHLPQNLFLEGKYL